MFKKIMTVFGLMVLSAHLSAALTCVGQVTEVMDNPNQCAGQMAYKTDNSNGKWFCSLSESSGSIVLTALAAGKPVTTVLSTNATDCAALGNNYMTPNYVYISASES